MFTKGQTVNYFCDDSKTVPTSQITINRIVDGKATSISGSFGGMGPFLMEFDAETGKGFGQYSTAHIEPHVGPAS